MQDKTTLELPRLPIECNPNWRGHWSVKNRAVQQAKHDAKYIAMEAQTPRYEKAVIQITVLAPTQRVPDPDNAMAMAKPFIDGLVLAGAFADDNHTQVSYKPIIFRIKGGLKHGTIIEIEEAQ
jgi:hypothetical protein